MFLAVNQWRQVPAVRTNAEIKDELQAAEFLIPMDELGVDPDTVFERLVAEELRVVPSTQRPAWVVLLGGGALVATLLVVAPPGGCALLLLYVPAAAFALMYASTDGTRRLQSARVNARSRLDAEVLETWRTAHRFAVATGQAGDAEERHKAAERERTAHVRRLLNGVSADVGQRVEEVVLSLGFTFESTCQVSVQPGGKVYILLDLPEIEDVILATKSRVLKSGRVSEATRSKSEQQEHYAQLVLGLCLQVVRAAVSATPAVTNVTLAAFTQRRAPAGQVQDEYVVEMAAGRADALAWDFSDLDPVEMVKRAQGSRLKLTKTNKLSRIPAPGWA